ncbi:AAA family ATPase, partial [bacterium]|nr:AAA family ATPase [bacterium]
MFPLNGFEIIDEIHSGSRSQVFRGNRISDRRPVIIKVLSKQPPEESDVQKHIQDYKIGKRLKDNHIISYYDWVPCHNGHAIIEEDYGAENLRSFLSNKSIGSKEFIEIAIQVVAGLETIHSNGIIHKDIKPENILLNEKTSEVKITDFSISADTHQEFHSEKPPEKLEGTLPLISPELTGRMNRPIDFRTDFYSLGVTFYFMLAGRMPFLSKDLLELIHAHIAIEPPSLQGIDPSIPAVLSKIVMKLMSKSADDRYQSAYGLRADLSKCRQLLEVTGDIPDFDLGKEDNSSRFHISDKLYGREKELEILLNTARKARQGHNELLLVSGFSGMGKTALINEIIGPVTKNNGRFISGKFEQSKTNIPYFGFIQAFANLVRGILAESDFKLAEWKKKLVSEMAPNGQVIIDVIPEIASITGDQPPVPRLEATDAQNRFNLVFKKFIQVVCESLDHVTIFLDNVQFADEASLRLVEIISQSYLIKNLLIVCSYRDNDTNLIRPILTSLERIKKAGINPVEIKLDHLSVENISQLINRSLKCENEKSKQLAEVVHQKTKGNPYFVNQFLENLYNENDIYFIETKDKTRGWEWDLESIKTSKIADNVIDLMIGKLSSLPDNTLQTLIMAAAIGNQFDANMVERISGMSTSNIDENLSPAVKEGVILFKKDIEDFTGNALNKHYTFLHDRVQQNIYGRMEDSQKETLHLKIGRILLTSAEERGNRQNLFEIVNHLNLSSVCITDPSEKNILAGLNLEAGKKAMASNAHESAADYFFKGIHLLPEEG